MLGCLLDTSGFHLPIGFVFAVLCVCRLKMCLLRSRFRLPDSRLTLGGVKVGMVLHKLMCKHRLYSEYSGNHIFFFCLLSMFLTQARLRCGHDALGAQRPLICRKTGSIAFSWFTYQSQMFTEDHAHPGGGVEGRECCGVWGGERQLVPLRGPI